ncbi:hypothetical protein E2562_036140 [Oryza meyeriana var. granulata]|uniref:Uncharacterized protein n=1 Tax=Oryza meyeriana var. granulata TaxID=110450 RepID=A0A6G1E7F8_9ORYZ|nr:hypothetical protein E2562_036140 [Oryza meyeriana var. granulata]
MEFYGLLTDATGQADIALAREVLKRLAAAASAHGHPSLRNLVIAWNKMVQKVDHTPTVTTDAAAEFLAALEDPKLTSLGETEKKPPIVILPPGMPPLSTPPIVIKKSVAKPGLPNAAQAPTAAIGAPVAQGTPMVPRHYPSGQSHGRLVTSPADQEYQKPHRQQRAGAVGQAKLSWAHACSARTCWVLLGRGKETGERGFGSVSVHRGSGVGHLGRLHDRIPSPLCDAFIYSTVDWTGLPMDILIELVVRLVVVD